MSRPGNSRPLQQKLLITGTVAFLWLIAVQGGSLFFATSPNQTAQAKEKSSAKKSAKKKEDNNHSNSNTNGDDSQSTGGSTGTAATSGSYTVLGYNELGMHCMNQDFSELCILPPFNTLKAQVIKRGAEPQIVTSGVTVQFSIPGNTISSNKTNFWTFAKPLFGVNLSPDVGLTGTKLSGKMTVNTTDRNWVATGIPATPIDDAGHNNPFQLSHIQVNDSRNRKLAETAAVVPVSWEISCNLCHNTPGISVATDILRRHDHMHGTNLEHQKPVLCASCHADPALGAPGKPGVSQFSHAMHGAHANRMAAISNVVQNACYACHPGVHTECQRDVHLPHNITCVNCHGDMAAVGNKTRTPWATLPTCAQCHKQINPKFSYEEPGKLFKQSKGHGGIDCASCHGPQHATGPATTQADNAQAILQQGHAGPISTCTVCHTRQPSEPFFHSRED